jgi:protein SCO1/2
MFRTLLLAALTTIFFSCQEHPQKLPILGNRDIQANGDTIYHTIPSFSFVDQDSQVVNNQTFEGKAYIADFFFTSCPTICPKVKKQMLRIYERFRDEDQLLYLSHTIDPKRDTVGHLKMYAQNLGVDSPKWKFVTGKKEELYEIADDYFSIAIEDPDAPGGYDHSGRIILVDGKGHIRSFCDGTDPEKVDQFMEDIEVLLKEMKESK